MRVDTVSVTMVESPDKGTSMTLEEIICPWHGQRVSSRRAGRAKSVRGTLSVSCETGTRMGLYRFLNRLIRLRLISHACVYYQYSKQEPYGVVQECSRRPLVFARPMQWVTKRYPPGWASMLLWPLLLASAMRRARSFTSSLQFTATVSCRSPGRRALFCCMIILFNNPISKKLKSLQQIGIDGDRHFESDQVYGKMLSKLLKYFTTPRDRSNTSSFGNKL